jgi:uncharacterized RDD family membrane protein YckC
MAEPTSSKNTLVYGDLGKRFVAVFIDGLIIGVVIYILKMAVAPVAGQGLFTVLRLAVSLLYAPLMISSEKQATIGKMAMHLKVTDMDGNRITITKAFIRELAKILSSLILLIGYIMAFFDSKKQALHDRIAETLVLKAD